jgi:flavin-dependent dehydrogenase
MSSLCNILRPPAGDGPRGLHAIGDATCVTNPAHTRGTTLALVAAQRLAEVVSEHPGDLDAQSAAMAGFVHDELALWVEDSIGQDAARLARWRPDSAAEQPRWRGSLSNGEAYLAAQRDAGAWRAFTNLQNTLSRPDEVLEDGDLAHAVARVRSSGWSPPPSPAPDHDELVALARMAAAG